MGGRPQETGIAGRSRDSTGFGKRPAPKPAAKLPPLAIRWESALPVRIAELKAAEVGAPAWEGDYYAVAVYDVAVDRNGQKNWLNAAKKSSALKVVGRKDLRPAEVQVLQEPSGLSTVLFLFPRSVDLTNESKTVMFEAVMGRLSVSHVFALDQMQMRGKLEL